MMRLIPASRAIVVGAVLALAVASPAWSAESAASAPAAKFPPTIYVGTGFGYADAQGSQYGWSVELLARMFRYGGIQLEYFNLGSDPKRGSKGDFDGLYLGLMPILPVGAGVSLFGQIGMALSDAGNNVAGGAGLLYDVPVPFLNRNHIDLVFRTDYKYMNLDPRGEHLLTFGFMMGFHK